MNGQLEYYLGNLFDSLAGTGARGHRAMVEIEDHLRCSIADLEAQGLSNDEATATALDRLGPVDVLARQLVAAAPLPWRTVLARLIGGAWLLGACALLSVGLSGGMAAAAGALWGGSAVATDAPSTVYSSARCDYLLEYYPQRDGDCYAASVAHHFRETVQYRLAGGFVGGVALASWFALRRSRRPLFARLAALTRTPPPLVMATLAATAAGLAVLGLVGYGLDGFATNRPWGAWSSITAGLAAAPAFLLASGYLLNQLRHRPAR